MPVQFIKTLKLQALKKSIRQHWQTVLHYHIREMSGEPSESKLQVEGRAEVYLPTSVFYNPVQQFNRDLTIAAISQHARERRAARKKPKRKNDATENSDSISDQESCNAATKENDAGHSTEDDAPLVAGKMYEDGLKILEGLAASGLRSVRFALEIPGVKEIVANDFDVNAVEYIKKNTVQNKVEHLMSSSCDDASMVMYKNRKYCDRFDVIDLDPYGSPTPFLDAAVQAVKDDGILCVTATDMAILCGNAPETCHSKYGAVPLRTRCCHEMALRIVLQCIESCANRYSRYIEPLMSISVDFYVRVFVRLKTGQAKVKESVTKLAMVYSCLGCGAISLQPLAKKVSTKGGHKFVPAHGPPVKEKCEHCSSRHNIGGPIWADRIHDGEFVQKVIDLVKEDKSKFQTADRIVGKLSVVLEELPDAPLYYVTDDLVKKFHCVPPNLMQIRSAIMNAGYSVSLSHAANNSLKTDAPTDVVMDIMRCWVKQNPVAQKWLKEGSVVKALLDKEPTTSASFEIRSDANPESRKSGLLRWQSKPERDWGPRARAKPGVVETMEERRQRGMEKAKSRKRKAESDSNGNE